MALTFAYFLDAQNWAQYGFVNQNVDPKKLRPIILRVQQTRLEPILGTTLYDKLVDDNPTHAGIYSTLMEKYVVPFLIAYCDWKYTFHGTSQMTNKTVGQNNDEHIRSNSVEQNNDLRDELIKDAKQIERKLIGWLCDNFRDIPELFEVDEDKLHESIRPQKKQAPYMGSIGILPKRRC